MRTTVANKRLVGFPVRSVYIGRGSKWGNPASHLPSKYRTVKVATRQEAIEYYREHLRQNPDLVEAARRELRGKVLVCYCAPLVCHGDVLARIADGGEI